MMAAPSWISKGADLSTGTGTPSFAVPSSTGAGKLVIITFFVNVNTVTVTDIPSGFDIVPGCPVIGASNSLQRYWKRLTDADVGTYDFTLSSSDFVEGAAELYDNVKASGSPFDGSPGSAFNDVNSVSSPPVETDSLGSDRLILHAATCWSGGTWTPHTGYTKRLQPPVGLATTSDKLQAVAGSTGNVVATSTNSDKQTAHLVALIGTTVDGGSTLASISDEARTNMLAQLVQSEPQLKSNADLMREVLDSPGQSIIIETEASAATHLERYLITLRNT